MLGARRWHDTDYWSPFLNDDQKKKLDQLEQEPHPELHGNLDGATTTTTTQAP